MANVKITDLTELAAIDIATNDVLPIVDINNDSTKKVTIASIKTLAEANDLVTFNRLNANLNVLDANADAIEARRVANVTLQDAIETRRAANVTLLTNEDTALQARITANAATAASNDFITFTRLNANLDIVQDNVAAISVTLGIRGDGDTNDDVTVGTEELVFKGDTGITTSVSSNVVTIDLDDTAVTAGLYGGVSGGVTNVAAVTIDAQGRITNAANVSVVTNLDTLQDNINVLDANADAIETRRVANIAGAVSTITTGNLTASRALASDSSGKVAVSAVTATELGYLDGVTSAIQPQISTLSSDQTLILTNLNHFAAQANANIDVVSDNVDARNIQLNANIDVVQDNVAARNTQLTANINVVSANATAVEARRVANIAGAVSTITTGNLTTARALVSDGSGKIAVSDVTSTELGHLDGVTSAIQTQFTGAETRRTNNIAGAVSSITTSDLTASRALVSDSSGKVAVSAVTATELGHLDGVTSAIQTQITAVETRRTNNIAGAVSTITTGNLTASRAVETNDSGKLIASSVTDTELGKLSGLTATTTELNYVDITTLGTVEASKAVTADSSGEFLLPDDKAIKFGTGGDFTIKFDGTDAFLEGPSTGEVQIKTNQFQVFNKAGSQTMFRTDAGSITNLYNAGTLRLQTESDGVRIVGHLKANNLTADENVILGLNSSNTVTSKGTVLAPVFTQNGATLNDLISSNVDGAISTVNDTNLTASRALASDGSGKIAVSAVTATELGYLDGVSSAIQTQLDAKAALAGATFTGQVNMSDDLVVTGNLIVNGDSTTANSINLVVQDRMIMLANSATGAPSADVGLLFNRGNQGNAAFFYDESASTFKLSDTKDPSSNTSLSPVTSSNLDVGIITAATVTQNGANLDDLISSNVDGAISTVNDTNLTASRALASSGSGKIEVSAVTATELGYLDGVTSAIQTQLNAKQATITGAATTIDDTNLTASRAVVSDGDGKVAVSAVTSTELGYLDGVTSAIQTQFTGAETRRTNNIAGAVSTITTGNLTTNRAVVTNGSGKVAVSAVTATELGYLDGVTSAIQTQFTGAETRRTNNIAGAVSTITTGNLTASRALASDSSGKVAVSAVTSTELGYLDGVTSAIQTQLNAKQATITGAATTIDDTNLTASRAVVSDGDGKVAVSAVTATEIGYLDGVTSAIQTQLNAKQATITGAATTIDDADLTASRALVSDGSGKVSVSTITATEIGHLDGIDQNINSNLAALASGIVTGSQVKLANADSDFGTLTSANIAGSDAFGQAVGGVTNVDMLSDPSGELDSVDLVALS